MDSCLNKKHFDLENYKHGQLLTYNIRKTGLNFLLPKYESLINSKILFQWAEKLFFELLKFLIWIITKFHFVTTKNSFQIFLPIYKKIVRRKNSNGNSSFSNLLTKIINFINYRLWFTFFSKIEIESYEKKITNLNDSKIRPRKIIQIAASKILFIGTSKLDNH